MESPNGSILQGSPLVGHGLNPLSPLAPESASLDAELRSVLSLVSSLDAPGASLVTSVEVDASIVVPDESSSDVPVIVEGEVAELVSEPSPLDVLVSPEVTSFVVAPDESLPEVFDGDELGPGLGVVVSELDEEEGLPDAVPLVGLVV